jgi:hypothetical protein
MAFARTPGWITKAFALPAAVVALLAAGQVRAADVETRTFTVQVDGKKAGDYQLVIGRAADGTTTVSAQSEVGVTILAVPVYTYSYRATEVWKDGRLQHFLSKGKEKGKEFDVRADLDGVTIRVQANGAEHRTRADAWPTSCWQLPPAAYRNNAVMLMGCDTGADRLSKLEYVGAEKLTVAGQMQTCTHYRVMKDALHEIWYDAQERIVRDEWTSSGHKTVVVMTGARK